MRCSEARVMLDARGQREFAIDIRSHFPCYISTTTLNGCIAHDQAESCFDYSLITLSFLSYIIILSFTLWYK